MLGQLISGCVTIGEVMASYFIILMFKSGNFMLGEIRICYIKECKVRIC
jgi:hypothetical protein